MVTLSYQLWAARNIESGEELTVAYAGLDLRYNERMERLRPFGFRCTCSACMDPGSDKRRKVALGKVNWKAFRSWSRDNSLPDNHILVNSFTRIKLLEAEGLEASHLYCTNYLEAVLCYVALGDQENANKYTDILEKYMPSYYLTVDDSGGELKFAQDLIKVLVEDVTKHEWWACRKKLVKD